MFMLLCAALLSACGPPVDPALDGGQPDASVLGFDGGVGGPQRDPCQDLVWQVCGVADGGGDCTDTPACEAARLTQRFDQTQCGARLRDLLRYPACGLSGDGGAPACVDLRIKCCGYALDGGGACATTTSCANALAVVSAADNATCRQALGDDSAFPRCGSR